MRYHTLTMTTQDDNANDQLDLQVLQAENESLKQEIESLQEQLEAGFQESPEALKELAARAQADLQNAKDRLEREAVEIRMYAKQGVIAELLPTVDNFQRAFAHLPEDLQDHDWVKGVQAIEQELMRKMFEAGLVKMECIGQQADPEHHEVLQAGPGNENEVTEVFEDGYLLGDKVLRPAKVKVGDGS